MVNVKNYTDKQLIDKVKSLSNFKNIPIDYWLLGVRSNKDAPNTFDDKVYLFKGETFILVTSCTTNPGTPALIGGWKKVNKDGAFVLKADYWHHNMWKNGFHNKMKALVQTGNVAVGYRDNNNNNKAEEIGKLVSGWFGINFHFNSYQISKGSLWGKLKGVISWVVGEWSYGCQVCNNADDYKKIIDYCSNQKTITYCLLNEF